MFAQIQGARQHCQSALVSRIQSVQIAAPDIVRVIGPTGELQHGANVQRASTPADRLEQCAEWAIDVTEPPKGEEWPLVSGRQKSPIAEERNVHLS